MVDPWLNMLEMFLPREECVAFQSGSSRRQALDACHGVGSLGALIMEYRGWEFSTLLGNQQERNFVFKYVIVCFKKTLVPLSGNGATKLGKAI